MTRLEQMRDRSLLWPFPSSPCRNYNVLGAGYCRESKTWDLVWPGFESHCLTKGFDELVQQFHKFVTERQDHREYTELGCEIISQYLKKCQAILLVQVFV